MRQRNDINTRIRELRDEVQSTSSRSQMSSKVSSERSASRSTKAIKAEAAAKVAEIKVQIKYQEAELEVKRRESHVKLQKELGMAEARLHAIEETGEDATLTKLPEAEEDAERRVESYIQTLPIETTMQQDIQAPVTAVPASTAINMVLVGPSGVVPATGTPTPVVPPVLLLPTSTALTLPVVTSSILTSSTSWLTTLPSASVLVTPVKASVSFPTTDRVFIMVPPPIFSTRVSSVGPDIRSVSFMLNPSAPDFVPLSTVIGMPGLAVPSTCVSQQHPCGSVQSLGISHSLGFDPQHFVPGGQQTTTVSSHLDSAMDSTRV